MTSREKINDIIDGTDSMHVVSGEEYRAARDTATDRILAAVRETMLSDEVTDAARSGFVIGPTGAAWTGSMTAALTAAGITESEVENG